MLSWRRDAGMARRRGLRPMQGLSLTELTEYARDGVVAAVAVVTLAVFVQSLIAPSALGVMLLVTLCLVLASLLRT